MIADSLADYVFEPEIESGGFLATIFGNWLGTFSGAEITLLYGICSVLILLVSMFVYAFPDLRNVENILPDCG